jgi:small conductance mechanosensitive channel
MTHGWSRAKIEIGISYSEDTDRVMLLLLEIVNEMRQEAEYDAQIVAEPEMLGVDELGDSAVKIVFLVKTRPLCQWKVKRELLRRIKHRFDELGIEIPFPQRVVTHRYEHAEGTEPSTLAERKALMEKAGNEEEEITRPRRKAA